MFVCFFPFSPVARIGPPPFIVVDAVLNLSSSSLITNLFPVIVFHGEVFFSTFSYLTPQTDVSSPTASEREAEARIEKGIIDGIHCSPFNL